MEWLGLYFNYVDTQEHAIIMPGSVFILPPYTREKKNHLDNAGIKPGSPARQASTLSITPLPLGHGSRVKQNILVKFDLNSKRIFAFLDPKIGTGVEMFSHGS